MLFGLVALVWQVEATIEADTLLSLNRRLPARQSSPRLLMWVHHHVTHPGRLRAGIDDSSKSAYRFACYVVSNRESRYLETSSV